MEDRPGILNAPNTLSSSCIRNPVWVLPQRQLGDAICFVAAFSLAKFEASFLGIRYGVDDDGGTGTSAVVRNSAQLIHHDTP